ncbi:MAG TPA: glycogen/starch synthase [Candidatus Deferrimicrobiaceae bacterium]|nr:glycogen/starch synthase [Candidatus Deferrimicrobiaceae bacterium]
MRVAFIAAECEPWAKTGGLADVVDALARALGQVAGPAGAGGLSAPVDVFLPRYRAVPIPAATAVREVRVPDPRATTGTTAVRLLETETHGYRLRLIDHPPAFDRDGLYGDASGDYPDNAWRFGLFCRAALEVLRSDPSPPDLLHLHDWHAVPAALLRDGPLRDDPVIAPAAVVMTVHNLAYHGWTPAADVPNLGLGSRILRPGADGIDLLAAGIDAAELVNTVSPGFAAEARTAEYGMGLDERLQAKGDRFLGILNGLDTELWDPAADPALASPYSRADRSGKAHCRAALLAELGMDAASPAPLLAMIGRLDPQKGFDLLAEAAPALLARGLRLAILGSGTADHVRPLRRLAAQQGGRVAFVERFDRDLARRMYAGADGFLMPSRFEPCGTGQMIALRYGTPPIVRATGGLRDTVVDAPRHPRTGTGFWFEDASAAAFVAAAERFLEWYDPGARRWEGLLDRGMAVDFDWRTSSAPTYIEAYRRAIALRAEGRGAS